MVFNNIGYNAERDICEVDQIGFIDLRLALETGTVQGDLNPDDMSYNEIDNPASIKGKPSDIFDAVVAGHQYAQMGEASQSSDEDKSK